MCLISDKIKFCTCVATDIDIYELNHYWVLHRYNKDKNEDVMGSPVLPVHLHTTEAFDKNIELKRGDRLEVVLYNNQTDTEPLYYNFKYTGKIWKSIEPDCFDLMSRFDEVTAGEIKE